VLLLRDDESIIILLPRNLIPEINEGDIVDITVIKDQVETESAKKRSQKLSKKLQNTI
jgi:hypothetical protein